MCLLVFAYKVHPTYRLIVLANRDEFYVRPTCAAQWWDDYPLLAGRDLKSKGTWLGLSRQGRFAAVTNYRDPNNIKKNVRTRGMLPVNYLAGKQNPSDYAQSVHKESGHFQGFNLLAYDNEMIHYSNYEKKINLLTPGIYGLSNALLDTPWPKLNKAKKIFADAVQKDIHLPTLIDLFMDQEIVKDELLPHTGLPVEKERALSSIYIQTPSYGTCSTTALTIGYDEKIHFLEKSHPITGRTNRVNFNF